MKLTYREDIDGLRAISVLAVVFNHAGIGLFSGGYVGVDIFFVISGYLITSIIMREIDANDFSIVRFYERRIRRILPALFSMVAFTVAVCALIYDAEKFREFGKSVIATTLFASNINFWRESGYFDAPSQLKPLLHTWSLAVEEQFYIFFPLLMYFLFRYVGKFAHAILISIALISFGFSIYTVSKDPSAAFYLAHIRAWELIIGAILALRLISEDISKKHGNILGMLGLAMIFLAIFQYSENTKFPGLFALLPVLGAAFIIFSGLEDGRKSFTGRLLSLPPLAFVGKISYSLYLWHWPLIIFSKYYAIRPLTTYELSSILAATIFISTLSWRFIETPFRSKGFMSTGKIYSFAASGMATMLAIGVLIYYLKGFPDRQELENLTQTSKKEEVWLYKDCNINATDAPTAITACKIGDGNSPLTFMVWGDSHTPTYGKAIHASASQNGVAGILTYGQGCPTFLDMTPIPQIGDVSCLEYNKMALTYLEEHPEIKTVILASRWTIWIEETRYKSEEGIRVHLTDTLNELPVNATGSQLFTTGLERTIQNLLDMDRKVVIVAPIPEIGYDVPSANFIASQTKRDINEIIAPSLVEYQARNQKTFAILKTFEEKYAIQIIEPWKSLCQEDICRVAINGIPLYSDDDHLSVFGSEFISPIFDSLFESIKN